MSKIVTKILAIIVMMPIMIIGIGVSIVWNVYLLIDSIIREIKRKRVKVKKRIN